MPFSTINHHEGFSPAVPADVIWLIGSELSDAVMSTVRYELVENIGYCFYGPRDSFRNFWWPAFQRVFHFDRRDELLERLKQLFQISPAVWANK